VKHLFFRRERREASIDRYNACVVDRAAGSRHTSKATVMHSTAIENQINRLHLVHQHTPQLHDLHFSLFALDLLIWILS
jgi:hypothetical protein